MGRGQSSGGGQSSLGYLFGGDDPAPAPKATAPVTDPIISKAVPAANAPAAPSAAVNPVPILAPDTRNIDSSDASADMGRGAPKVGVNNNNYHRDGGQNNGNFITDRPTTRVHAAPGGGSSLGYLFGGP
eukprot:TRINITY_DN6875_c0_g1_i1.p1 TRINITY_DN6875_c0_g1~~TRINITY_DN6875_c0_g1_i1.p1  ORF type:complete len:129 (-),score=22.59 TRINITY_DN6875_c0_g1_i1:697-1083(-)